MRKIRIIAVFMLALLVSEPAWAVFYEKDMKTTLSILLQELRQTQEKFRNFNSTPRPSNQPRTGQRGNQRVDLDELTEQCNKQQDNQWVGNSNGKARNDESRQFVLRLHR